LRSLTFRNAHEGWTLGLDGRRVPISHRTRDGGQHWQTLYPTGLQSMTEVIMELEFLTSATGWTINKADDGTLRLFQTDDGAEHWRPIQPLLTS
jgi:photosystem II stability/assembly factor-like uncharacterized protein